MNETPGRIRVLFVSLNPLERNRRLFNQIQTAAAVDWQTDIIAAKADSATPIALPHGVRVKRFSLWARSGPLMFIGFNVRLFFALILRSRDVVFVRGVWPLPAVLTVRLFKKFRLVYDAHEYFAGLASLRDRPRLRHLWLWFEKQGLKRASLALTVSEPILARLQQRYPFFRNWQLIRNLPSYRQPGSRPARAHDDLRVVYHGYFMPERGLENLLLAFTFLKDKNIRLTLIGDGLLKNRLRDMARENGLESQVRFLDMQPYDRLFTLLQENDLGVVMLIPSCENHRYALPNKFFEYIMAGLPVLASDIPTLRDYIDRCRVGITVDAGKPQQIAEVLMTLAADKKRLAQWRKNCAKAAAELCWEKEEPVLRQALKNVTER